MIIVKEYKNRKKLVSLSFYERISFRVEGKVKKKDYYIITLKTYEIDNVLNANLEGMEELQKIKDAIIKYKNKQAKKLEEKIKKEREYKEFLKNEGFVDDYQYKKYLACVSGKLFNNKEEFFKTRLSQTREVPFEILRYGFKAGMDLDYWITQKERLLAPI